VHKYNNVRISKRLTIFVSQGSDNGSEKDLEDLQRPAYIYLGYKYRNSIVGDVIESAASFPMVRDLASISSLHAPRTSLRCLLPLPTLYTQLPRHIIHHRLPNPNIKTHHNKNLNPASVCLSVGPLFPVANPLSIFAF